VSWSSAPCEAESDASRTAWLIPSTSLAIVAFSLRKTTSRPSYWNAAITSTAAPATDKPAPASRLESRVRTAGILW
jgi:hypothetical protein